MSIKFSFIAIDKNKAWIIPVNLAGIVEVDLFSGTSKLLAKLDGYTLFDDHICGAIQKIDDCIGIAPILGEDFYIYNTKKMSMKRVSIGSFIKNKKLKSNLGKFRASFCSDKSIYFVGCCYPGIVKIDTEKEQIKVIDLNIIGRCQIESNNFSLLGKSVAVINEKVYIPRCDKKGFLIFDLEKEEYEIQQIGNCNCAAVCTDGRNLCLIPEKEGNIEIYDIKEQRLKQVVLPEGIKGEKMGAWYSTAIYHCGYAWIFPSKSNMLLRLNLQTEEIICIKEFKDITEVNYSMATVYDVNKICGFYYKENRFDIIDCYTFRMESKFIYPPYNINEFIDYVNDLELYMKKTIKEEYLNVAALISYICNSKYKSMDSEDVANIGSDIWNRLKADICLQIK